MMMLSSIASRSVRLSATRSMAAVAASRPVVHDVGRRRGLATDSMKHKEKVEEDRYMREQERSFFEKKKVAQAQAMADSEQAVFQEKIAPAMVEAQEALKKSGDAVSDAGLELLARWKMNL